MEDQESLQAGALVSKFADAVQYQVDDFLSDGVVTTSVVVGGIFLASDELFGVEQLTVSSSSDLVDDSWLEIDEDSAWNVLASSGLAEEGVE